jgi:monothiol glutaredoxin
MTDDLKAKLDALVKSKRVVVFMKGSAMMPACGFSAQALQSLRAAGMTNADLATVDVLRDPAVRDGIKEYSSWPTIPQVFIGGEFVGGCDIVKALHARGELATLINPTPKPA